jgi:mono/diheme cytochrome c family protein
MKGRCMTFNTVRLFAALAVVWAGGYAAAALAEEGGGSSGARAAPLPAYQQECAACHTAFPARGLPAASWQHLMANLPKHFGTDASLDAKTSAEIAKYLQANAATGRRAQNPPAEDRITRADWFTREHREISAAVWQRASIGKPSNCAACHTGAPQGRFSEHDVRIPK